jgi:adiponectin receptor
MSMRLLTIEQIDPVKSWYVTNPFIKGGYRPPQPWLQTFYTAFQWHNETLSIYSHLIPGLVWLWMFCTCGSQDFFQRANPLLQAFIQYAYLGAATMGLASGFGHTFHVMNQKWAVLSWKIDYTGILAINSVHQGMDTLVLFYPYPSLLYTAFVLEGLFVLYCLLDIWVERSTVNWGLVYPLISSTVLTIPAVTFAYFQQSPLLQSLAMCSLGCSMFISVAGCVFFMGKLPERVWNPNGLFDNFNSHWWHHVFVVLSIVYAFQSLPLLYRLDSE